MTSTTKQMRPNGKRGADTVQSADASMGLSRTVSEINSNSLYQKSQVFPTSCVFNAPAAGALNPKK